MGTCKSCGKVVSSIELENGEKGVCKACAPYKVKTEDYIVEVKKGDIMPKSAVLSMNIVLGIIFGSILTGILWLQGQLEHGTITLKSQSIIGLFLTSPLIVVMLKQTYKVKDKSMLYLGGPTLSASVALTFYILGSIIPDYSSPLDIKTAFALLVFVCFFSCLQAVAYYGLNRKQKKKR